MKKSIITALVVTVLFAFGAAAAAEPEAPSSPAGKKLAASKRPPEYKERESIPDPEVKVIENFKKYADGQFPKGWKSWPMQGDKVKQIYAVKTEGGKNYVRAFDDKDLSQQIMKIFIWDIEKYPYLNWKWRPKILPGKAGLAAREDKDNQNDSACGVYVVFGRYTGVATKYVWSSTLPVGQMISRRGGELRMEVVGTGSGGLNQWKGYSVNVPQSYKKLFGEDMKRKPTGFGILSDGNATHTPAECDYTDFSVSMKPQYTQVSQ